MANFWRLVNNIITDSDILLLLLDARLVDETRNIEIEDKIKKAGKPLIYVITKSDLVDTKILEKYKGTLSPMTLFSSKERLGTKRLRDLIHITAKQNNITEEVYRVGVLGYPNVGKSSLINTLKGKASASASEMSGHTRGIQKIRIDKNIMLFDTPGVIPYKEKEVVKHTFIGTIDHVNAKDPDLVVIELLEKFPGIVENYYGVEKKDDKEETIEDIAVKKSCLKKGGIPDTLKMSRVIIKDWQKGNIR